MTTTTTAQYCAGAQRVLTHCGSKMFLDEDSEYSSLFADVQDEFLLHLLR